MDICSEKQLKPVMKIRFITLLGNTSFLGWDYTSRNNRLGLE